MSELSWLAAVLAPYDLAIHPNFASSEAVTGPSVLASIVAGRSAEFHGEDLPRVPGLLPVDLEFLEPARDSLHPESILTGAQQLLEVARRTDDVAKMTSATLLAVVGLMELDRIEESLGALHVAVNVVASSDDQDRYLCLAALNQQLALRRYERAFDVDENLKACDAALDAVVISELSVFPTSEGVLADSAAVLTDVVAAMREGWLSLRSNRWGPGSDESWLAAVRSQRSALLSRYLAIALTGHEKLVHDRFTARADVGDESISFGHQNAESTVYRALLCVELLGHPSARRFRLDLGVTRTIDPDTAGDIGFRQDSIRLIRQARDKKGLDRALRLLRNEGPLVSIRDDARQIIESRSQRIPVDQFELRVLKEAGPLLDPVVASSAYSLASAYATDPPNIPGTGWSADFVTVREGLDALRELAPSAGRQVEFIDFLIGRIKTARNSDEAKLDAIVRSALAIDWTTYPESVKSTWVEFVSKMPSTGGGDAGSRQELLRRVDPMLVAARVPPLEQAITIEQIAVEANRQLAAGGRLTATGMNVGLLQGQLEQLLSQSRGGIQTMGGIDFVEMAASLATQFGATSLWDPLVDVLLEPSVRVSRKAAALERIAQHPKSTPVSAVQRFRQHRIRLLNPPDQHFAPTPDIFGAALRALVAMSVIEPDEIFGYLLPMVNSEVATSRIEAAKTLKIAADQVGTPDWLIMAALVLSRDADAGVAAQAGQALAMLAHSDHHFSQLVSDRLAEMIGAEGVLIPLLALRAIATSPRIIPLLRNKLMSVSVEHLDSRVREAASRALLAHATQQ